MRHRSNIVLLAVDLREVIEEHARKKAMYDFYTRFSLSDIIETVLSVDPYIMHSIHVYDALEMRFSDDDVYIDRDLFTIFFECLAFDVDTAIAEQYAIEFEDIKTCSYLFDRWIDKTSLLIRIER